MRVQSTRRRKSYTRKRPVETQRVSDAIVCDENSYANTKPTEEKVGFFRSLISVLARFFK